jgi:KDO2-lipid IV(A) lauroyltransferase
MLYKSAKILRAILLISPLWFCLLVGRFIGFILYLNPKRRRTAFRNIKSVFPAESNSKLQNIIYRSFMNMGISVVELLIAKRIMEYIDARGVDNLKPEGGIVVAVHEGSWEFHNAYLAQHVGYAILAKEQKEKGLDRLLNELRSEYGIKVSFTLKDIIRHIRAKTYIGMAVDHGAEDNAAIVKFFSHYIPAPGGAVYLAKRFNIPLYPCFGRRIGGFRHIAQMMAPIIPGERGEVEVLQEINSLYEEQLLKYPEEYIWSYKRFKKKKDIDVVILNDGKLGHLKQSLAFLFFLRKHDYYVRHKIIDIQFKHSNCRNLADVCAMLAGKNDIGDTQYLKFLLPRNIYTQLASSYADIVISSGSFLASVNRIFAYSVGAKAVSILRPNIPLYKFDVAILPEHDRVGLDSTIRIKGALCYPVDIEDKARRCCEFFKLGGQKKIAVFIGGVMSDKREFMSNLRIFCEKLRQYALDNGYKLLISTSRRTSEDADAMVKEIFYNCDCVEALVFPNHVNYDFVFDGFVHLADKTFVSGESISMISEAASLSKPCIAINFEKHEGKHKVFLDMVSQDIPLLRNPYDIADIKVNPSTLFEENRKIVEEAIARLL